MAINRNVEIKARITGNLELLLKRVAAIADEGPTEVFQDDTFFACPNGRLKVRTFSEAEGELIYYERPDSAEPKSSHFVRSKSSDPRSLCDALSSALGIRGIVRKKRTLYITGQTRVHLDEVENLGSFVELEVVLSPQQTTSEGNSIAQEIMEKLGINKDDLVGKAYIDLLQL